MRPERKIDLTDFEEIGCGSDANWGRIHAWSRYRKVRRTQHGYSLPKDWPISWHRPELAGFDGAVYLGE